MNFDLVHLEGLIATSMKPASPGPVNTGTFKLKIATTPFAARGTAPSKGTSKVPWVKDGNNGPLRQWIDTEPNYADYCGWRK